MNVFSALLSFWRTLVRGYLSETPVRGSRTRTKRYINEALLGSRSFETLQVQYEIGSESWEFGRTLVVIRGDGTVHITNATSNQVTNIDGSIASAEFREVLVSMRDGRFHKLDPMKRSLAPDESEIMVLLIETTTPDKFWIKMGERQAQSNAPFWRIVITLREILKRVGGGRVI